MSAAKPAAFIRQYHDGGELMWENEGGNCTPLFRATPLTDNAAALLAELQHMVRFYDQLQQHDIERAKALIAKVEVAA